MSGISFNLRYPEKEQFNQYWFSQHTISKIVEEIQTSYPYPPMVACISTPSVYYTLPDDIKSISKCLDYDEQFKRYSGFVKYDFNAPEEVPIELMHSFDICVIDPPFITREVWQKYAVTARLLLKEEGRLILSSIVENAAMLNELLGVFPVAFKPSIPHLIYQYNFYTNYDAKILNQINPEICED